MPDSNLEQLTEIQDVAKRENVNLVVLERIAVRFGISEGDFAGIAMFSKQCNEDVGISTSSTDVTGLDRHFV